MPSRIGMIGKMALGSKALLVVVAIGLAMVGCAPLAVDGLNLDGTRWRAISIAGEAPIAGSEPTLVFEGGSVRGTSGCNGFTGQGQISVSNGRLELGQILMTLGGCVGPDGQDLPVMALEQTFWSVLNASQKIAVRGDQLVLSGSRGELVFTRQT